MAEIQLELKLTSGLTGLERGLRRLNKELDSKLRDLYTKTFGTSTSYDDWKKGKINTTKSKLKNESRLATSFSQSSSIGKQLTKMYVDAWKNKYDKIRQDYKSADSGYRDKQWSKWKSRGKGKYRTPHYPNRQVRYSTWGLTSGYLRQSIERGFQSGGNRHLKLGNLLVQGGFELDWDSYPKRSDGRVHYREFVDHLVRLGVLADGEEFINFLPSDWQRIANYMFYLIENNFVDNIDDILDTISIKI